MPTFLAENADILVKLGGHPEQPFLIAVVFEAVLEPCRDALIQIRSVSSALICDQCILLNVLVIAATHAQARVFSTALDRRTMMFEPVCGTYK